MALKPSVYLAGRYPTAPIRHRSNNSENYRDLLLRHGFTISELALEADILLALDFSKLDEEILRERKKKHKMNILFRNEPKCVIPDAYLNSNVNLFDSVLSFGAKKNIVNRDNWAQFWPERLLDFDRGRARLESAALINANKLSLNSSELYTLRRRCINALPFLRLYGEGWNAGFAHKLKTLAIEIRKRPVSNLIHYPAHGRLWFHRWPTTIAPQDKISTLSGFKYCLVIENDLSYMSEKLFDALFAGCIPIYVGPPISDYGIPDDLVIQAKASLFSIVSAYESAKELDHEDFVRRLHAWLSNSETKRAHSSEHVLPRAMDFIEHKYVEHLL